MRALAHPLRLSILQRLQHDGPATATMLAAACGESSGSTSFHLRQLAKHGFIEELPERGNARERWWQARVRGFSFPAVATASGEAASASAAQLETAAALLRSRILDQNAELLAGYLDREPELDPAWRNAAVFANSTTYLTVDELERVGAALLEIVRRFERHDPKSRPAGSRRVRFMTYGLPEVGERGADGHAPV
jgi:DNA-binding transcriptional ArsR family regulator